MRCLSFEMLLDPSIGKWRSWPIPCTSHLYWAVGCIALNWRLLLTLTNLKLTFKLTWTIGAINPRLPLKQVLNQIWKTNNCQEKLSICSILLQPLWPGNLLPCSYFQALCFGFGHLQGHTVDGRSVSFAKKRRWNVELLQDFFKSKAKHAPIWPVPLMNSRVGSRTASFLQPVCICLGWGMCQNLVKWHPNIIQTIQCSYIGFLSITVSKISGDYCSLSTPGSCSVRRSGLLLLVDPSFIDFSCHNRQVFCHFD